MIRWTSSSNSAACSGQDTKMQRDLNSPNKLRHAQPTRKFVRKQPVFSSEQTWRKTETHGSEWEL